MNRALRAATMGVLLLSPLALSACSAGQVTQTATQERDKVGSMAKVGDITIRQASLEYPDGGTYEAGDDAPLVMAIVNASDQADTLTDISGEGFSDATISDSGAASPSTSSAASTSATPSAAATPSAGSGTPSSTPARPTTAAPTTAAPSELEIPAGSSVFIGSEDAPAITLNGLDEALTTGGSIELTLTFENAGEVTLLVSVGTPGRELERGEPFDFHHEAEEGGEVGREGGE
ncbi:hypothetical protein DQ237_09420 [Blastococcus sp. TF02-8]|uniref:hypothetical protein n=1 Tax=Blastococcus sp. TF02-8 TaxID=2250574 RepID=UPI000DE9B91D|nr:hypothetical protein [Blastococcus sp. TF02-8]RBY96101.1 hypothetical protein DQ237_09420 [Blastococcus sp. TF02-8]